MPAVHEIYQTEQKFKLVPVILEMWTSAKKQLSTVFPSMKGLLISLYTK